MTCVRCEDTWYNWVEYLVVVYLPLTVFYFIILFFQVNMTSSYLLGFLTYSHTVSFPMLVRLLVLTYHENYHFKIPLQIGMSLYGIWNLDFFRIFNQTTCLRHSILFLSVLELVSGIYPLFLILLTYTGVYLYDNNYRLVTIAIKPICALIKTFRLNFEIKTSLINSFSTFFLLSGNKLFATAFDLLAASESYTLSQTGELGKMYKLYLDGNVKYFRGIHVPYCVLAVIVLIMFIILPILCFLLYPFQITQKCISCLPTRLQILVHTFVDTFQGSLKNGTESGTRDYRWFSLFHFAFRGSCLALFLISSNLTLLLLVSILLTSICLSIVALRPFKENSKENLLNFSFLLYMASVYLCIVSSTIAAYKYVKYVEVLQTGTYCMVLAPLGYITTFAIYKLWKVFKHSNRH